MIAIMQAFKGTSKVLQNEVAKDIEDEIVTEANFHDLLAKYMSRIHTTGDAKPKETNTADKSAITCHRCGNLGHKAHEC